MIHAEADARDVVRGTKVKSEAEIKGMTEEKADSVAAASSLSLGVA
jgi:hypothetical protein